MLLLGLDQQQQATPAEEEYAEWACWLPVIGADETLHANMGGPMSRTRSERIRATVLGNDDGYIRCPLVTHVGLDFENRDPLQAARELLASAGLKQPEELRGVIEVPQQPLLCRPAPFYRRLRLGAGHPPETLLRQLLILGLCTTHLYNPARPVLFTRASLTRCLALYEGEGFYA